MLHTCVVEKHGKPLHADAFGGLACGGGVWLAAEAKGIDACSECLVRNAVVVAKSDASNADFELV